LQSERQRNRRNRVRGRREIGGVHFRSITPLARLRRRTVA
jgi:hypothetical protein